MKNNRALRLLFYTNALFVFAAMLLGPLYAVYVQKIGGGVMAVSISSAAFYISSTVALILVSKYGDKYKEKEVLLVISWLIRGLCFLSLIFVNSVLGLVLVQVVFGLGEALGTPTFNALFAEHVDRKHEVMEYSDWSIISNIVTALSVIVGGLVVSSFGFSFLFVMIGIMCFASGIWVYLSPRNLL